MKKTLLLTASFATLGVTPVLAADLAARNYTKAPAYVAPLPPSWAGFYLGVNGGADWSHNCWTLTNAFGGPVTPAQAEGCHSATSGVVGGQLGYRWQANNWVFGLEAQGDWTSLKASNVGTSALGAGLATNSTKTDALGLFTGQIGYAWGTMLWYVKGGAALAHNKYTSTSTAAFLFTPVGTYLAGASETRWGGTVGTGVEYAFAPGWSVAAEYDHLFMGSRNINFADTPLAGAHSDRIKQDVDMATVRVNYRFGGPVVARY